MQQEPVLVSGARPACGLPRDLAAACRKRIGDMREEGRGLVRRLAGWGLCPPPEDLYRTVDLCRVTAQHSTYTLLVRDCGWTPRQYEDMLLERLLELLDR